MVQIPGTHRQASNTKLWMGAFVSVTVIFALFIWILWRFQFFSFTGTDPSSKVVAASITLVGGLLGALVTLLGLVLKHSLDERSLALKMETEAREKIEFERSNRLAQEAEQRLKVETAIKAVGLLSTSTGHEVTPTQRAGVILTLGDLGMLPLALSLTDQMLGDGTLDAGTACWLFNKALTMSKTDSPDAGPPDAEARDVQLQAAILTDKHVAKMLRPGGGAKFPAALLNEKFRDLPVSSRHTGAYALIDLLMIRHFSDWDPNLFFGVLDAIHSVWKQDENEGIKNDVGVALRTFIRVYKPEDTIAWSTGPERCSELIEQLSKLPDATSVSRLYDGRLRSRVLAEWLAQCERDSIHGGVEHGVADDSG